LDWLSVKQDHATATAAQPVRKQDALRTAEAHVRWGPVRHLRVQPTVPPLTAEPLAAVKLAAAQTAQPAAVQPIARQLEGRVRFFFPADILGYPKRALISAASMHHGLSALPHSYYLYIYSPNDDLFTIVNQSQIMKP